MEQKNTIVGGIGILRSSVFMLIVVAIAPSAYAEVSANGYPVDAEYEQYLVCKYNTFAADYNFLEISNPEGRLGLYYVQFPQVSDQPTEIQESMLGSLQRTDVDIHSRVGANALGLVVIPYRGATLEAAVSYYQSKDGQMIQRAHVPCYRREFVAYAQ